MPSSAGDDGFPIAFFWRKLVLYGNIPSFLRKSYHFVEKGSPDSAVASLSDFAGSFWKFFWFRQHLHHLYSNVSIWVCGLPSHVFEKFDANAAENLQRVLDVRNLSCITFWWDWLTSIQYSYLHILLPDALTKLDGKCAAQRDTVILFFLLSSSASTCLMTWSYCHAGTYVLSFFQNEKEICTNETRKIADTYSSTYYFTLAKLQGVFSGTNLEKPIVSFRVSRIPTTNSFSVFCFFKAAQRRFAHPVEYKDSRLQILMKFFPSFQLCNFVSRSAILCCREALSAPVSQFKSNFTLRKKWWIFSSNLFAWKSVTVEGSKLRLVILQSPELGKEVIGVIEVDDEWADRRER